MVDRAVTLVLLAGLVLPAAARAAEPIKITVLRAPTRCRRSRRASRSSPPRRSYPDFGEFMMNSVIVHPDYARQNPETVREVVRALLKASAWLLDHAPEEAVPSMKTFLGRLDDKVILDGLRKTRLGIPRDGRITERTVALTEDFLIRIGALKSRIPYDRLVTHDFLPW